MNLLHAPSTASVTTEKDNPSIWKKESLWDKAVHTVLHNVLKIYYEKYTKLIQKLAKMYIFMFLYHNTICFITYCILYYPISTSKCILYILQIKVLC